MWSGIDTQLSTVFLFDLILSGAIAMAMDDGSALSGGKRVDLFFAKCKTNSDIFSMWNI